MKSEYDPSQDEVTLSSAVDSAIEIAVTKAYFNFMVQGG